MEDNSELLKRNVSEVGDSSAVYYTKQDGAFNCDIIT